MTEIKCPRCEHEWDYTGKSGWFINCPRCNRKMKSPYYHNTIRKEGL